MRIICYFSFAFLWVSLAVRGVQAQPQNQRPAQGQQMPVQSQDQSTQPASADRLGLGTAGNTTVTSDTNVGSIGLSPDARSLAGARLLSLGAPKTGHTVWNPYFSLSQTVDTNSLASNQFAQHGWSGWTAAAGGVRLRRISGASDFDLMYDGSGSISDNLGANPGIVQQLGIAETHIWRRYSISVMDQVGYLPQAGYGIAGTNPQTSFATNGAREGTLGLQPGFIPDQSILTSYGQRISNTFIAQIDRHLTPLSSLTLVGSYGLLHYFQNNLVNDTNVVLQAGYNHQIDRKNTIALFYKFAGYRFANTNQFINDNSVQLSYARRVTGRLAFQFFGGPDLAISRTPFSTCGNGCVALGGTNTRDLFWSLTSTLNYQFRRTALDLSYNHGISSGSGVLLGSVSDNFSGDISRQVTRSFDAGWLLGYSRSSGYAAAASSTATSAGQQTFDYAFTGANLRRRMGRSVELNFTYEVQFQRSNSAFCIIAPCGTNFLTHQISLGFGWRPNPNAL
jgi:hypothetical protein